MFHLLFLHVAVRVLICCDSKISIFAANVLIYLGFVLFSNHFHGIFPFEMGQVVRLFVNFRCSCKHFFYIFNVSTVGF
jgi:hypothetical protein